MFHGFQSFIAQMSHEGLLQTHFQMPKSPNLPEGGHKDAWASLSEATICAQASDKATSSPANSLKALLVSELCTSPSGFFSRLLSANRKHSPAIKTCPFPAPSLVITEIHSYCNLSVRESKTITNLTTHQMPALQETPAFMLSGSWNLTCTPSPRRCRLITVAHTVGKAKKPPCNQPPSSNTAYTYLSIQGCILGAHDLLSGTHSRGEAPYNSPHVSCPDGNQWRATTNFPFCCTIPPSPKRS